MAQGQLPLFPDRTFLNFLNLKFFENEKLKKTLIVFFYCTSDFRPVQHFVTFFLTEHRTQEKMTASEKLASMMLRKEKARAAKRARSRSYVKGVNSAIRRTLEETQPEAFGVKRPIRNLFGKSYRLADDKQKMNRNRYGFVGRGLYGGQGLYGGRGGFWGDLWNSTSQVRGFLGDQARGGAFGGIGKVIGDISKAIGTGAYVTNDIVNQGQGAAEGVPQFAPPSDEGILLSNCEFVSDVFGPEVAGAFHNLTFKINPGLFRTFPWLSQIADNYEEYELVQLIFTYKPTITDFVSTNGQVGTVIMATQYNSSDLPFGNKQDMMHYSGSMATKVSTGMLHGVECDPSKNAGAPGKFVRGGPILDTQDITNFDLGTLNVAVCNTPAEFNQQALGELWVSYTVKLRKPKFYAADGSAQVQDMFIAAGGPAGDVSASPIYPAQQNRINGLIDTEGTGRIVYTFPATVAGTFEVRLRANVSQLGPPGAVSSCNWSVTLGNQAACTFITDLMVNVGSENEPFSNELTWSGVCQFGRSQNISAHQTTGVIAHIKVQTPTSVTTGGSVQDNTVILQYVRQDGSPTPADLAGWTLEVVKYNAYFDYQENGPPMLENGVTGQLVTPVM